MVVVCRFCFAAGLELALLLLHIICKLCTLGVGGAGGAMRTDWLVAVALSWTVTDDMMEGSVSRGQREPRGGIQEDGWTMDAPCNSST